MHVNLKIFIFWVSFSNDDNLQVRRSRILSPEQPAPSHPAKVRLVPTPMSMAAGVVLIYGSVRMLGRMLRSFKYQGPSPPDGGVSKDCPGRQCTVSCMPCTTTSFVEGCYLLCFFERHALRASLRGRESRASIIRKKRARDISSRLLSHRATAVATA